MKRHARIRISPAEAGLPLVEFLSRRFTYHDGDTWLNQIAAGRLQINDAPATASQILNSGDQVEYRFLERPEPAVNVNLATVYEDADLLVIDKPPHLPCHPGGRFFAHTLWAILKQREDLQYLAIINRLDRETSGLVLVAETPAAEKSCRSQFTHRQVEKRYLVLVEGRFPDSRQAAGWLTRDLACEVRKRRLFIEADPSDRPAAARVPASKNHEHEPREWAETAWERRCPQRPDAEATSREWAETAFRLIRTVNGLSLVEARPVTGRQHQIRATLATLGFPVVGDKLYGVDPLLFLRFRDDQLTPDDRRRLRLDRQALHAAGLRFHHPVTRELIEFDLPLPADMAALLQA